MAEKKESLNVIDIEYNTKEIVADELRSLPEEFAILVVVSQKNYENTVLAFAGILLNEKKLFGTYITTNKPFRKIMDKFLQKGIKADNLFFIDCITKEQIENGNFKEGIKVFSSENVNEINVVLDRAIKSRKQGGEFILLDAISTLLVYNDEKTVEKFIHSLLERIYRWKTKGIFLTVETQSNRQTIENLSLFFDRVIRIIE